MSYEISRYISMSRIHMQDIYTKPLSLYLLLSQTKSFLHLSSQLDIFSLQLVIISFKTHALEISIENDCTAKENDIRQTMIVSLQNMLALVNRRRSLYILQSSDYLPSSRQVTSSLFSLSIYCIIIYKILWEKKIQQKLQTKLIKIGMGKSQHAQPQEGPTKASFTQSSTTL